MEGVFVTVLQMCIMIHIDGGFILRLLLDWHDLLLSCLPAAFWIKFSDTKESWLECGVVKKVHVVI